MIGTRLGSYEIIEEIGKGGMATVYRAYHPNTERDVAIKVIHTAIMSDPTARDRFSREARLVARLEHPHLLPIHDFDGENDPPYLVMRYLEGGTLKDILGQRRLPFNEITYLTRQIASALDYAHRQGIVHRDIKPSNVMIDREGNAFVTDFGIARMVEQEPGTEGITGTGAMVGTPDYMPPEQGHGRTDVDARADVYSLGVMFFQMLTGELPFRTTSPITTILRHINEPVPSLLKLNPELPQAVDTVVVRAMAKAPEARYTGVTELSQALIDALGGSVATSPVMLQQGAQESIDLKQMRRSEHIDEINTVMQQFAEERGVTYIPAQDTPTEQQRQMTALQVDISELGEMMYAEVDEETGREALNSLWDKLEKIATEHGGVMHGRTGDDGLVLWGLDQTREDAPEQAIRAGLEMKDAAQDVITARWGEVEEMPFRVGITTGLVLLEREGGSGSTSASGPTVTLVSKIKDAAGPGVVLVAYDTFTHVRGVFDVLAEEPVRIRGREPVEVFSVQRARPRAFRLAQRGIEGVETAMVGREPQMKILTDAIGLMIEDNRTQVVTVVGEAGVGKSRLLYEFSNYTDIIEQVFWFFEARATLQMMLVPYALTRDLFSFRFEIADNDASSVVRQKFEAGIAKFMGDDSLEKAHYIGQLVGFDFTDIPAIQAAIQNPDQFHDQALRYLSEFFIEASKVNPVLIQIEDIHWADDKSLDLINNLVSRNTDIPLFVICMARPGLYERRPTWGEGQRFHARIALDALSLLDTRRLIKEILKKVKEVHTELRDMIADRAEGNPFYVEELIKTLIDDRVIIKHEAEWAVNMSKLATVRVPPTLTGVLQARLDSLPPAERTLLQRASVIGRIFWDTSAEYLSAAEGMSSGMVQGALKDLREREMIFQREETIFAGANEYVFRHAILRDVTYESIAPKSRRNYHALAAQWLEEASGTRAGEYATLIADHYEKAGEAAKAVEHLRRAGDQIYWAGSIREALALYERALALPFDQSGADERVKLHVMAGRAHGGLTNYADATKNYEAAQTIARETGNEVGQASALTWLSDLLSRRGELATAIPMIGEAVEMARRAGDKAVLADALRNSSALMWLNGDFSQGMQNAEEARAIFDELGDKLGVARSVQMLANISFQMGNVDAAFEYHEEALALAREMGSRLFIAVELLNIAEGKRVSGDFDAARKGFEEVLVIMHDAGDREAESLILGNLAQTVMAQGKIDEAKHHLQLGVQIANQAGTLPYVMFGMGLMGVAVGLDGDAYGMELIGAALAHPASDISIRADIEPWLPQLEEKLGKDVVEAGMKKGETLDFDKALKQVMGN